jgi:hypothetical protein
MATLRVAASRNAVEGDIRLPSPNDGLLRSKEGDVKPCEHNARVLIAEASQYGDLHYDEFLSRMRYGARDWIDADEIECLCWLQSASARRATVRAPLPIREAETPYGSLSKPYQGGTARRASNPHSWMRGVRQTIR